MDGKGHSVEVSDRTEGHVMRQWRKGNPYFKVAKNLIESCSYSSVLWKVDVARDEIEYLTEEISKQGVGSS